MSPSFVLRPTYDRLKRSLMDGHWAMGTRLEALKLADDYGVSMTPVRDSLNQLVGEGLVEFTPGEGFRVASLNEQDLRDVLFVNRGLLEHAVSVGHLPRQPRNVRLSQGYETRLSAAFRDLANLSRNRFLVGLVERMNERLHPIRYIEPTVLPNAESLLARIEACLMLSANERLDALREYHETCEQFVPQVMAALPR